MNTTLNGFFIGLYLVLGCSADRAPELSPASADEAACSTSAAAAIPVDPNDPGAGNREAVLSMLDDLRRRHLDPRFREIVTLPIKPTAADAFKELTAPFFAASKQALGVGLLSIELGESPNPSCTSRFLITDVLANIDAARQQWNSPHLKAYQAAQFELLAGPPDLRFYLEVY
jgi:quinol monooxygenase YgiN